MIRKIYDWSDAKKKLAQTISTVGRTKFIYMLV